MTTIRKHLFIHFPIACLIFSSCVKDVPVQLNVPSSNSDFDYVLMGQCTYLSISESVEFDFEIYELNKNTQTNKQWTINWYNNVDPISEFEARIATSSGTQVQIKRVEADGGAYFRGTTSLSSDTFWLFLKSDLIKYDSIAIVPFKGIDSLEYHYNYHNGDLQSVEFSFQVLQDSTTVFFDPENTNHAGFASSDLYSGLWNYNENFKYRDYVRQGHYKELLTSVANFRPSDGVESRYGDTLSYEDLVRLYIDGGFLKPSAASIETIKRNQQLADFSNKALNPYTVPKSFPLGRSKKNLVIEFYSYQSFME